MSHPENASVDGSPPDLEEKSISPAIENIATNNTVQNTQPLDKGVATSESSQPANRQDNEPVVGVQKDGDAETSKQKNEQQTPSEEDEETKYQTGPVGMLLLAIGLCITTFLIGLDQMIVATAIPKITDQFHSLNDVGWYGSAYLLTTTSLQPSFGRVYSYFNVKWTFLAALLIFEVGSVICAVANGSTMLIIGRAIAGVGAAGLFSGGMTIIGYSVPLQHRPMYIAALSSMFGVASIVGPILGGTFTDNLTWRWCFWINLPFGGAAMVAVFFFFKNPDRDFTHISFRQKAREMDPEGASLLICAVVCLLLALQWGGIEKEWRDSTVWGCLLGFVLIISLFIFLELRKGVHATIPTHILKQRSITAAALTLCFMSMGLFTHIFYLPFYFQVVKDTSAQESGIRCIAYLVSNTIGALISGLFVTILGYYTPFIWIGTAAFAIGSGLLYLLRVNSSRAQWIGYQILAGAGSGSAIQLPFIAVQTVLSAKDMPTGNAIAIFFNTLGGAVSISVAQNIFTNSLVKEISKTLPGVSRQTIIEAGATNVRDLVPASMLPRILLAFNNALNTAFVLPIAVACTSFLSSLLFEWKSVKGKKLMHVGGAA